MLIHGSAETEQRREREAVGRASGWFDVGYQTPAQPREQDRTAAGERWCPASRLWQDRRQECGLALARPLGCLTGVYCNALYSVHYCHGALLWVTCNSKSQGPPLRKVVKRCVLACAQPLWHLVTAAAEVDTAACCEFVDTQTCGAEGSACCLARWPLAGVP